jgi:hypothetical protein
LWRKNAAQVAASFITSAFAREERAVASAAPAFTALKAAQGGYFYDTRFGTAGRSRKSTVATALTAR